MTTNRLSNMLSRNQIFWVLKIIKLTVQTIFVFLDKILDKNQMLSCILSNDFIMDFSKGFGFNFSESAWNVFGNSKKIPIKKKGKGIFFQEDSLH